MDVVPVFQLIRGTIIVQLEVIITEEQCPQMEEAPVTREPIIIEEQYLQMGAQILQA